jgi:hypothetical protein
MRLRSLALVALAVTAPALTGAATASTAAPNAIVRQGELAGDLGSGAGAPMAVARTALGASAARLGVDANAFRFERVRHSLIGTHVTGREVRGGVPVDGTWAGVHILGGRVRLVQATASGARGGPTAAPITQAAAVTAAAGAVGVTTLRASNAERLLVAQGAVLVDTYRVAVLALTPAVAATIDVAAADGSVLAVRDDNRYEDAVATVFDPNPIVTARNPALREPGVDSNGVDTDLDSAELTAQLKDRPLTGFDTAKAAAGNLVGPWVDVQGPAPIAALSGRVDVTRGDPRFEAVMTYVHLDRLQKYFQSLGFTGNKSINAEPQNVIAVPVQGYDNSFYQPGNDLMVLGAGGVDDGEDAEVTVHEYGHAVHDAQNKGWSGSGETGAMGEGWGDFLAAAYYARTSGGFQDPCLMDWDSTSYSSTNPKCIRRTDSPKTYPKNIVNEVHADGELWSTFLWRIREQLGTDAVSKSDNVLTLVLTHHELLSTTPKFKDAVAALKTAAIALGHEKDWVPIIDSSAEITGFPTS